VSEPSAPSDPLASVVADFDSDLDAALAALTQGVDLDELLSQLTAGTPSLDELIADLEATFTG
jgi:hypothetical protein